MLKPLGSTGFVKQPAFRFKPRSVILFIVAASAAWVINIFGQQFFPSQNLIPFLTRVAITFATDLGIIYFSFRLLNQNNLPKETLGLSVSSKTIAEIGWGILIGVIAMALMAGLLYLFIPYHFVSGPCYGSRILKESISYIAGNTLEELIFRGFLFILFSQLAGWRLSALIMALPFGLFHLQMMGPGMAGLKMVCTTACFSFVFSLSYVLFRSMWASITVHVVSNILLHAVTGLDGGGNALFLPYFEKAWPITYDAGFIVAILSALIMSVCLFLAIVRSEKVIASIDRTVN